MSNYKHRSDLVDGLRGYCIILVILFHSNIKYFHSCFIGVDFTFILSGYLLTKSSLSNIRNFRMLEFYMKRFYRILPCFSFMLFSMVMYEIYKGIIEVRYLEEYLFNSMYLYNIYLSKEKEDYFFAIHSSYLIPYWSLSIEIQFYLLFPLILSINKMNENQFKIIIMLILLSSLIYEIYENNFMKDSSIYYSLLSRIWEFMLGIMLNVYKMKKKIKINIDILTSMLIIIPILNIKMNITLYRIIESIIFMMILKICEENEREDIKDKDDNDNNNERESILLNNEIIKWFGKHSYILYLIHYPILQLEYNLYTKLLLMLIVSIIIYEEIENKIQKLKISPNQKHIIILLLFLLPLLPQLIIYNRFITNNNSNSHSLSSYNISNNGSNSIITHKSDNNISYFESNSSGVYRSIPLNIHTLNKPIDYSNVIIYNANLLYYALFVEVCNSIPINHKSDVLNNRPIAYVIGDSYIKQWMGVIKKYCYERNITLIYTNIQVVYFKSHSIEELLINKKLLYEYHFDMVFVSFSTRLSFEIGGYESMMLIFKKLINVLDSFSDEIFVFQGIPFNHAPGSVFVTLCHTCLYEKREYCFTTLGYNESYNDPFPSLSLPNYHLIDFYNPQFCYNNICSCVINNKMVYDHYFHVNPFILRLFNNEFTEYMDNITQFKYKKMREYNIRDKKALYLYGELYFSGCIDSEELFNLQE